MQRNNNKKCIWILLKKGWNVEEENKGIREISDQDSTGIRCSCLWK